MHTSRRELLQLIAMGRISPAEAERLIAVWNEGRETFLVLFGCLLIVLLAQAHTTLPWLLHIAKSSLPQLTQGFHHALTTVLGL